MEKRSRENRLRIAAKRQGLRLIKNGVRDPLAVHFGKYILEGRAKPDGTEHPGKLSWTAEGITLDAVEIYLTDEQVGSTYEAQAIADARSPRQPRRKAAVS